MTNTDEAIISAANEYADQRVMRVRVHDYGIPARGQQEGG